MEDNIKDSYDKICEKWSEFRKSISVNQRAVDFVNNLSPNSRVLDTGCGTRYPVALYLSKQGFQVTGIGISEEMIKQAQKLNLYNTAFLVEDILNFKTNKEHDAIIAFDSIWHIRYDKQECIYQIISSLLTPGGLFLFTYGKNDDGTISTIWKESFYHSALNLEEVHKLLKQNGFDTLPSIEDYIEEITGDRELFIIAKKKEL